MDVEFRTATRPRGRIWGVLAATAALLVTACGPAATSSAPAATTSPAASAEESQAAPSGAAPSGAGGTVTVGFISPTTGFVAALGTDMKRGWELYWELN